MERISVLPKGYDRRAGNVVGSLSIVNIGSAQSTRGGFRSRGVPSREPLSGGCGNFGLLRYDLRKWLSKGISICRQSAGRAGGSGLYIDSLFGRDARRGHLIVTFCTPATACFKKTREGAMSRSMVFVVFLACLVA